MALPTAVLSGGLSGSRLESRVINWFSDPPILSTVFWKRVVANWWSERMPRSSCSCCFLTDWGAPVISCKDLFWAACRCLRLVFATLDQARDTPCPSTGPSSTRGVWNHLRRCCQVVDAVAWWIWLRRISIRWFSASTWRSMIGVHPGSVAVFGGEGLHHLQFMKKLRKKRHLFIQFFLSSLTK